MNFKMATFSTASCIFFISVFQEQEENKSATSWPEYYIDQLNLMAAVSTNTNLISSSWLENGLRRSICSSSGFFCNLVRIYNTFILEIVQWRWALWESFLSFCVSYFVLPIDDYD